MDEACPKCGADDGIAGKCAAMFVAQNAEIASLSAELAARDELIAVLQNALSVAIDKCDAAASQDAEEKARQTKVVDLFQTQAGQLREENCRLRTEILEQAAGMVAAKTELDRRAEEKARLRKHGVSFGLHLASIITHWDEFGADNGLGEVIEAGRAALACTPTGMPSGVQQAEEIARLREALKPFALCADWMDRMSDQHRRIEIHATGEFRANLHLAGEHFYKARAALACRPQSLSTQNERRYEALTDERRADEIVAINSALQTEQTMHAAWRKRAEEAEAALACRPQGEK